MSTLGCTAIAKQAEQRSVGACWVAVQQQQRLSSVASTSGEQGTCALLLLLCGGLDLVQHLIHLCR
jgi:hypothetical protein